MRTSWVLAVFPLALATQAASQDMGQMAMPGMDMSRPVKPSARKSPPTARALNASLEADPGMRDMPGMTMPAPSSAPSAAGGQIMPGMAEMPPSGSPALAAAPMAGMAGMDQDAGKGADAPAASPPDIPKGPAPPPARDHLADRYYDPANMAAARAELRREHGGETFSRVLVNLAEYQARSGAADGFRWDGEAWLGGDLNRLVVKSEGEGSVRGGALDGGEAQALYSRAVGPYLDVQGGVRQDFARHPRTYATIGVQDLLPYMFDVQAAVFVSNKGEVLARAEALYELRLTQVLILQPRVELNFAAQDTRETRVGSGLSNAEFGLRLRYEITREFAPYIGVSYDRRLGKTADYVRAAGEDPETLSLVAGIRTFF